MARITTPREGSRADPWPPPAPIAAPLRPHDAVVAPEWADYNGHMSESAYLLVHVDTTAGRATPFPPEIASRLAQIRTAHAGLPAPGYAGRSIRPVSG